MQSHDKNDTKNTQVYHTIIHTRLPLHACTQKKGKKDQQEHRQKRQKKTINEKRQKRQKKSKGKNDPKTDKNDQKIKTKTTKGEYTTEIPTIIDPVALG